MARLLENEGKELLRQAGISVPRYDVAESPEEARKIAAAMGKDVVLKALVPVGKRGKAGAVKFAEVPEEAGILCQELLGMNLGSYPVQKVLVEEKLVIEQEMYVSITVDRARQREVVIASTLGGIDIEEISRQHSDRIVTRAVDPMLGLSEWECRQIWHDAGLRNKELSRAAGLLASLYRVFRNYDCYLLELNPVVLTRDKELVAAAVVMGVDDAAIFRHPDLAARVQMGMERTWRPLTELEKQAIAVNEADPYRGTARYTEMDGGDIGFMCGGGGGSLLLFDSLLQYRGRPTNYSEFGGNPTAEKVYGLVKVILSKPGVRGLFVAQNITNNTQVDLVAEGVIRALEELRIDPKCFPVVVREAGVNEEKAREVFAAAGVEYYGDEVTMSEAARRMVEKMREVYPGYGQSAGVATWPF